MLIPSRSAQSAEIVYDIMCRYLVNAGWRRENKGSGWWWKDTGPDQFSEDALLADAVRQQLDFDGIDIRNMRSWEPRDFWGNP